MVSGKSLEGRPPAGRQNLGRRDGFFLIFSWGLLLPNRSAGQAVAGSLAIDRREILVKLGVRQRTALDRVL